MDKETNKMEKYCECTLQDSLWNHIHNGEECKSCHKTILYKKELPSPQSELTDEKLYWEIHDKIYNGIKVGEPDVSDKEFEDVAKSVFSAVLSHFRSSEKEKAIGFTEWIHKNDWEFSDGYKLWINKDRKWENGFKTIDELYEKYLTHLNDLKEKQK